MGVGLNGWSYCNTKQGDGLTNDNVRTLAVSHPAWWGTCKAAVGSPVPKTLILCRSLSGRHGNLYSGHEATFSEFLLTVWHVHRYVKQLMRE